MTFFKDCGCGCNGKKQEGKFIISVISGLTFFIVANPETFRIVRRVFGDGIATPNGCPSTLGLLVHTLVFILITWGMMNIKRDGGVKTGGCGCGCGTKKGSKVVVRPTTEMVDAPDPTPDFTEPQTELVDSGRTLEPMGLDSAGSFFD